MNNYELYPKNWPILNPADPIDKEKYLDFLQFITKFDDFFRNNEQFLISSVRNDLLSSITSQIYKEIKEEIAESEFVSFIVNEAAELEETMLISTIVRFITKNGGVRERFLNFQEVSSARLSDSVFSQSYDGGVVTTNELYQLQKKVKELCPNALFLHYCEHSLNSILVQSISTIN